MSNLPEVGSLMHNLGAYAALLEEIAGHEFKPATSDSGVRICKHEMHNSADSVFANICWRANAAEFIDSQSCPVSLHFKEGDVAYHITCRLPRHDNFLNHEGVIAGPRAGHLEDTVIKWNSNTVEGSRDA